MGDVGTSICSKSGGGFQLTRQSVVAPCPAAEQALRGTGSCWRGPGAPGRPDVQGGEPGSDAWREVASGSVRGGTGAASVRALDRPAPDRVVGQSLPFLPTRLMNGRGKGVRTVPPGRGPSSRPRRAGPSSYGSAHLGGSSRRSAPARVAAALKPDRPLRTGRLLSASPADHPGCEVRSDRSGACCVNERAARQISAQGPAVHWVGHGCRRAEERRRLLRWTTDWLFAVGQRCYSFFAPNNGVG